MKKLFYLLSVTACALVISGCASADHQQLVKSTVFGFQAKSPGTAANTSVVIQFGLIRSEFLDNPTSTNGPVFAAQFSSHVDAHMSALSQTANESFSTLPQAFNQSTNGESVITSK